MCGIAGIVKLKNSPLNLCTAIVRMTDAIRHRGPDGEGFLLVYANDILPAWGDDSPEEIKNNRFDFSPSKHLSGYNGDAFLAFGHRRLSIIDLSPGGHQPMCVKGKQIWITYNGEIYNYIELREELEGKGYRFQTNSDTEVILNSYLEWGEDCLEKFNGMWAFVIYDREKNELFGARDRFGVKPFYYYLDDQLFAFASEQKALLKLEGVQSGINPAAAFDFFLKNIMEHEEEGLFKNIIELFPAYAFRFSIHRKKIEKWKYYSLPVNEEDVLFSTHRFSEAVSRTRELFFQAIALRLRSDVPVGSCLSGGIDSSAIVCAADEIRKKTAASEKLRLFTACFDDKQIDESDYAGLVAQQVNGEWNKIFPSASDLSNDLNDYTLCQDIPVWSTSGYAQFRLMQAVKEKGVKVVLNGQGGDELFAGYYPYHFRYWMDLLRRGQLQAFRNETAAFPSGLSFFMKQWTKQYGTSILPSALRPALFRNYFHDVKYLQPAFWEEYKKRLSASEDYPSSLNGLLAKEMYNHRLKVYLRCEDRSSMWHSVESRTPFSDDIHLIEYIFSLPSNIKIRKGVNKKLLRESLRDLIPEQISNRRDKKGFMTPNLRWISEMKDQVRSAFKDQDEYINVPLLLKDYDPFFNSFSGTDNNRAFRFISFAKWREVFGL